MTIRDLTSLLPPPDPRPRGSGLGDRSDAALGDLADSVPADVAELAGTYGAGSVDDFLWLLSPSHPNPNLDTVRQRQVRLDALRQTGEEPDVLPPGVDMDQLLPWAVSDNGDVCYVVLNQGGPSALVLVNDAREGRWEAFAGSSVDFLVAVLSGTWQGLIFPADFPSGEPRFRPATT